MSPCHWEDAERIDLSDDAVPKEATDATVSPAYRALSAKILGIHRLLEERASTLHSKKARRSLSAPRAADKAPRKGTNAKQPFTHARTSSLQLLRIKHSKPGTALHTRFMQACAAADCKNIMLVFHGSHTGNIESLCRYGLDPQRRRTGGDWFAIDARTSVTYCRGGQKMLVCAVLTGPEHADAAFQSRGMIVLQRTELHLVRTPVLRCAGAQALAFVR